MITNLCNTTYQILPAPVEERRYYHALPHSTTLRLAYCCASVRRARSCYRNGCMPSLTWSDDYRRAAWIWLQYRPLHKSFTKLLFGLRSCTRRRPGVMEPWSWFVVGYRVSTSVSTNTLRCKPSTPTSSRSGVSILPGLISPSQSVHSSLDYRKYCSTPLTTHKLVKETRVNLYPVVIHSGCQENSLIATEVKLRPYFNFIKQARWLA